LKNFLIANKTSYSQQTGNFHLIKPYTRAMFWLLFWIFIK